MATYKFSALTAAHTFPSFKPTDVIEFNNRAIDAANSVFTANANGDAVLTISGKAITFTGLAYDDLLADNFLFANGGKMIFGDIKDNTVASTALSDFIDGKAGNDTVSYEAAEFAVGVNLANANPQNTGGGGMDKLSNIENLKGSKFNDVLFGNNGNNTLDGAVGIDIQSGGNGNDIYYADNPLDQVFEQPGLGTGNDTVISTVDFLIPTNVENLILQGNASNGMGNAVANVITGNARNNTLIGGSGADLMIGLGGDDTYGVDNANDVCDESSVGSGGFDVVESSVTYSLGNNVEALRLMGGGNLNGTGGTGDNTLFANLGNNTLDGGGGTDTVSYRYGATRGVAVNLSVATAQNTGGSGSDTLVAIENLTGSMFGDTLTGNVSANKVDGGGGDDILNGGGGNDTLIGGLGNDTYVLSAATGYTLVENGGQGTDTAQAAVSFNLSASVMFANVENLTLVGANPINGIGNSASNIITGNDAANTLAGGNGNDLLDGRLGVDQLSGGSGNDTYVVDDLTDTVTENASDGSDTVLAGTTYTLPDNTENLTLTGVAAINGTGNDDPNIIAGNNAANILAGGGGIDKLSGGGGNDELDGGTGGDILAGGDGNDTYYVDTTSDTVTENTKLVGGNPVQEGTDTVVSTITYKITSQNVENLTLAGGTNINGTGSDGVNTINGNGGNNILLGAGGNDTMLGNNGNDSLDGGKGADNMQGGIGNDTYYFDDAGDKAIEAAGAGTDLVISSVSATLAANADNLTLVGTGTINGKGNADDNKIVGSGTSNILNGMDGNDILDGGAGADKLTGGLGDDVFFFTAVGDTKPSTPDQITDFTGGDDVINIANLHTAALTLTLLPIKGTDFTHTPGEIRYAASGVISENTTVSVDLNGDANADFSIVLTGFNANMTLSDFVV
jgi:Ca2+-binding RTX toxin-like protein